jgi:hypothetical protein
VIDEATVRNLEQIRNIVGSLQGKELLAQLGTICG